MRFHHTKTKGDLGVLHVQLDLARKGYGVLVPLTEHETFDIVAYRASTFLRVQVKYRAVVRGVIAVPFSTSWADRRGTHTVAIDRGAIDVLAVYCPDTDEAYYLDPQQFPSRAHLRIAATANGQQQGVVWARDFRAIPSTVAGIAAGPVPAMRP